MSYSPFMIADFQSGLESDREPWLLPKDAFTDLTNAYLKHGVIKKRSGVRLFAKFPEYYTTIKFISEGSPAEVWVTDAAALSEGQHVQISSCTGGLFPSLNGKEVVITNLVGAIFDIYDTLGNPIDTTGFGAYAGLGIISIYPERPIMGIKTFTDGPYSKLFLAFDTRRAALYNGTTDSFDPLDTADIFTGDNSSFVSVGFFGKTSAFATPTLFFTNFNGDTNIAVDNMRTFTGGTTTTAFLPDTKTGGGTNLVNAAQFIHTIRQRLLLFNTVESLNGAANIQYPQRVRWSKALSPATGGDNWNDTTPGNGGYVDAPTADVIIATEALQDQIIVYFSNSTWSLVPTSDPALPFRWNKINNFRAADAPYGSIAYDRFSVSYGVRGITACDGNQVDRIDDKIEDFVVDHINLTQFNKVYSARDYVNRFSWTFYPSSDNPTSAGDEQSTSDRALIHNEDNASWSIFLMQIIDDAGVMQNMSCLGHGEAFKDYLISDFNGITLPDQTFAEFGEETYQDYFYQEQAELLLAGDQVGRIFVLQYGGDDNGEPIGMELMSAAWNPFKDEGAEVQMGRIDLYVDADPTARILVEYFSDDRNTPYASQEISLLPEIGFVANVQNITQANPAQVVADEHGLETGQQIYLYGMTGMQEIQGGPYTVTVMNNDNFTLDGIDSSAYSAFSGYCQITLNPFAPNTKCWKRLYAGGIGYQHFVRISSEGPDQIVNIHAIVPWFRKAGSRMAQ